MILCVYRDNGRVVTGKTHEGRVVTGMTHEGRVVTGKTNEGRVVTPFDICVYRDDVFNEMTVLCLRR